MCVLHASPVFATAFIQLTSCPSAHKNTQTRNAGISAATIGRKQAFTLPERPEFVFEEEAAVRRRGWGENLQFYTGMGYLLGADPKGKSLLFAF
jgi:hypothetical protein